MDKTILKSGLVALVVAVVVGLFNGGTDGAPGKDGKTFGAGPDVFSYLRVYGPFTQGGGINRVSQITNTYTLTGSDMADYNVITFTASTTQAAFTVTLPASTTFPLPDNIGARRSWIIENPFTAAATTTTIAAGTGIDLQEPDGQNVVVGINNYAWIDCVRGADTGAPQDIVCSIDETIPAD